MFFNDSYFATERAETYQSVLPIFDLDRFLVDYG